MANMHGLFTPRAELLIRLEEARDKRKEARIEREISAKNARIEHEHRKENARIEHEHRKANAWLKEVSSEFTGEEYSQEEAKEVFKGCMLLVRRFEKTFMKNPPTQKKSSSLSASSPSSSPRQ